MFARVCAIGLCCIVIATLSGCGGDTTAPRAPAATAIGLASGVIGDSDFEIQFDNAGDPNAPFEGPFILRGTNLYYDDAIGALVVDFTIRNGGTGTYPLPVTMTFTRLLPDGVTVLNPDNDEHGPGAMIEFHFTNRDLVWSPGEESQPRTVQFGVDENVAVAFTSRLDIGIPPEAGTISGIVYMDGNLNGEHDPAELGLPRMHLTLEHNGATPDIVVQRWEAITDLEGRFEFAGLRAGHYTLTEEVYAGVEPTTPTVMHILLSEQNGEVTDFTEADFGCIVPSDFYWFRRGDFVRVKGIFGDFPFGIFATETEHTRCTLPFRDCDPADPGCPCYSDEAMFRGPVTRLPVDDRPVIEVMGVPVWVAEFGSEHVDYTIDPEDLVVGDMIETELMFFLDGSAGAKTLHEWTGDHVEVHGTVEWSFTGHSEAPPEIRVLGVRVFHPEPAPLE
jgi:hypothetical protein